MHHLCMFHETYYVEIVFVGGGAAEPLWGLMFTVRGPAAPCDAIHKLNPEPYQGLRSTLLWLL